MKKNDNKIDIVVLWVNSLDPKWQSEREKYSNSCEIGESGNTENRFRDWELMRFWFRMVEANMSWVNRIHFVTFGHIPEWLDTSNPKLNVVNHKDFIPKEYLPTFNSNVIQYYLNRIPGISDQFILFDDDQFVLKPVSKRDFFIGDSIREEYGEALVHIPGFYDVYPHSLLNNMECINANYNKRAFYKKYYLKCLNPKNGLKNILNTILLQRWSQFNGFYSSHICQAYTKKHYDLFWRYCGKQLIKSSNNRFRSTSDFTTFLVRYIALMEGDFVIRSHRFGKRFELSDEKSNQRIYRDIMRKKYSVICLNDTDNRIDFEKTKASITKIFSKLYPERSSYEK